MFFIKNDKNNTDLNLNHKKSYKLNLKNIFSQYNPLDSEKDNYEDLNSIMITKKICILILKS